MMTTIRPLPVRTDPWPGESWLGYTQRVADRFVMPWSVLMAPLHGGSTRATRYRLTSRMSGVAATDATLQTFARYLNLDTREVRQLHLLAYDGSALTFTDSSRAAHDPVQPHATELPPARIPLDPTVPVRSPRACPTCGQERPDWQPLSWRLLWHPICLEHQCLITAKDEPRTPERVSDTEALAAQAAILSRLTPSADNARFFTHLRATIHALLPACGFPSVALNHTPPHAAAAVLAEAVQAADTAGYPHMQRLDLVARRQNLPAAAALLFPPGAWQPRPVRPRIAYYPQLLPTRLFVPTLADLCYPASITQGRAASGIAVYMCTFGASLAAAETDLIGQGVLYLRAFLDITGRLEREGRLERFWEAAAAAALHVAREAIDYGARRAAMHDTALQHAAGEAAPAVHRRLLPVWLVDQWACTFTTVRTRVSARNGLIEHIDRDHGAAMADAVERALRRAA